MRKIIYIIFYTFFIFNIFSVDMKDIKMKADRVDFNYKTNVSDFAGNVLIEYKNFSLRADSAKIHNIERKGHASNNVMIINNNSVFFCDEVEYDFNNKHGIMLKGNTYKNDYIIKGEKIKQISEDKIEINRAIASMCQHNKPHLYMTAKEIHINKQNHMYAKHCIFWLGRIPIFYWPYVRKSVKERAKYGLSFRYNELFGFQVLTQYTYFMGENFFSKVLLDWYSKRGIGVGTKSKLIYGPEELYETGILGLGGSSITTSSDQKNNKDIKLDATSYETEKYKNEPQGLGYLLTYYLKDEDFVPNLSKDEAGEKDRYRITLFHDHRFSNRWRSMINLNYISDADMYYDFFTKEFDDRIQMSNTYKLYYQTIRYDTGLQMRIKLNPFYNVLERFPEVYYNWNSVQIGDTNFYYTSNNHAVKLKYDHSDSSTRTDFDAFRVYTSSNLSYTKKVFSWLTIQPTVCYEAFWYSKSLEPETILVEAKVKTEVKDEVTGEIKTKRVKKMVEAVIYNEADAVWRYSGFATINLTTNIYKIYKPKELLLGQSKYRHYITPTISYSFKPGSNLDNKEILRFDSYDNRVSKDSNLLDFVLLSRWQYKDFEDKVQNLLYTSYSISYDLDAKEDPWKYFKYYSLWDFFDTFKARFDLSYDINNNEHLYFYSYLSYRYSNILGLGLNYYDRNNNSNIVVPEISINFNEDMFIRGYFYYNQEDKLFERQDIAFVKGFHCLDLIVQFSKREFRDEQTIFFSIGPKGHGSSGFGYAGNQFEFQ